MGGLHWCLESRNRRIVPGAKREAKGEEVLCWDCLGEKGGAGRGELAVARHCGR